MVRRAKIPNSKRVFSFNIQLRDKIRTTTRLSDFIFFVFHGRDDLSWRWVIGRGCFRWFRVWEGGLGWAVGVRDSCRDAGVGWVWSVQVDTLRGGGSQCQRMRCGKLCEG
jgi:hypothetical protein